MVDQPILVYVVEPSMSHIFVTLPSNHECKSAADVQRHWLDNKPLKMYQGNWVKREQEGILNLMKLTQLVVIWQLPTHEVLHTTIDL